MMESRLTAAMSLGFLLIGFTPPDLRADECPCNADVTGDSVVNALDLGRVWDCFLGVVSNCATSDVNCDGRVDFIDISAVFCVIKSNPDCCNEVYGPCTDTTVEAFPPCFLASSNYCNSESVDGTYHGPAAVCSNGVAVPIPTASAWALSALAVLILIGGTCVLRSRPAAA
jgi:hypothetical protein